VVVVVGGSVWIEVVVVVGKVSAGIEVGVGG
jgi:hypothetical protein